jgi:hypothetical protein
VVNHLVAIVPLHNGWVALMVVSTVDVAPPRIADPAAENLAGSRLVTVERRRPGRREVSPELIPLLRGPSTADVPNVPEAAQASSPVDLSFLDDGGNPARGILIGMLLSLPLWGAAIWITAWLWG